MPLNRQPNIADPDDFYRELIDSQRGLSDAQAEMLSTKLVLILANHVGDRAVLSEAIALARDNTTHHWWWDRLVFKKVAARVGLQRCRVMATGSAPIAPHVLEFLRVVFGALIRIVVHTGEDSAPGPARGCPISCGSSRPACWP
jgi:hypothetical protein